MKNSGKIALVLIIALLGLSCVSIGNCYETTDYLPLGEFSYYGVEMNIGDNLTWSFNTYSEEFEVHAEIGGTEVSDGLTSDSGVWYAPDNDTFYLLFVNIDTLLFRDGYIDIYFEVNVEPGSATEDVIPSFNPLIIIGIIGCISGISAIVIKKRMNKL